MRFISLFLLIVFLSGCATQQYGSFTKGIETEDTIVDDALLQMNLLYPPAKTAFSMLHNVEKTDGFGEKFLSKMRIHGYAVQEYSKQSAQTGKSLAYILDKKDHLVRLTVFIDGKSLSRTYIEDKETREVKTNGMWTLME